MEQGIKALKNAVALAGALARAGKSMAADGKFTYTDLISLGQVVPTVGPMVATAKDLKAELDDLTDAERADLMAYAKTELDVDGEGDIEDKVLAGIDLAMDLYKLVIKSIAFAEQIKK